MLGVEAHGEPHGGLAEGVPGRIEDLLAKADQATEHAPLHLRRDVHRTLRGGIGDLETRGIIEVLGGHEGA